MGFDPGTLFGWVRLLHPFPSLVVAGTAVGFALTARPAVTLGDAARLFAMVLCSQFGVGSFNDYCDARLDTLSKPDKPIPAGLVPHQGALAAAVIFVLLTLALAASYGAGSLALGSLAMAAGLLYDFPLKRTAFSWLPYVLGLPLLPLWAWSTVGVLPDAARWAYPVGALLALALHLANALPDDATDRAAGTGGLVQLIGRRYSILLLFGSFALASGLAVVLLWSTASAVPGAQTLSLLGVAVGTGALLLAARSASSRAAFKLLAVGCALLAVGVASSITS